MEKILSPWQRFVGLLQLDKKDIKQIFFYAVFTGIVALSLPLGIQAIINLIQGAQISTSWIVLIILVTIGVAFQGGLQLMQIRILENIQQKIFNPYRTKGFIKNTNRFSSRSIANFIRDHPTIFLSSILYYLRIVIDHTNLLRIQIYRRKRP